MQKPAFSGERIAAIQTWPTRTDLWAQYIDLRQAGKRELTEEGRPRDVFGREAHALYLANFEEMNDGAVLANPYNFESDLLADGTQKQCSSLQRCYDYIADTGMESFQTEHQNDPPEESGPIESGITPTRVQRQLSGYDRRVVPPDCVLITQGIDVRKTMLHWVVRAWRKDGTGFTIDYGTHATTGTVYRLDEGVDIAVKRAILERMERYHETEYTDRDGKPVKLDDLTLIDAGWRTTAVYAACAEAGLGVMPLMGFGKSAGCCQANFSPAQKVTHDRKPGDGWNLAKKGKLWLVESDADRWKAWEHDRWMTATERPGTMQIFGRVNTDPSRLSDDERLHYEYALHICAEVEVEEVVKGVMRRKWKPKSESNHFLDASCYADTAANMRGIRLSMTSVAKPTKGESIRDAATTANGANPKRRLTLAEMAKGG